MPLGVYVAVYSCGAVYGGCTDGCTRAGTPDGYIEPDTWIQAGHVEQSRTVKNGQERTRTSERSEREGPERAETAETAERAIGAEKAERAERAERALPQAPRGSPTLNTLFTLFHAFPSSSQETQCGASLRAFSEDFSGKSVKGVF